MGDYFRSWKRKLGVVTLLMACVFAAGWVRSLYYEDLFSGPFLQRFHLLFSSGGQLLWSGASIDDELAKEEWEHLSRRQEPHESAIGMAMALLSMDNKMQEFSGYQKWKLSFWSLVIPLTILSAWILLRKPHAKPSRPAQR